MHMSLIPPVAFTAVFASVVACTGMPGPREAEGTVSEMSDGAPEQDWHLVGVVAAVQPAGGTTRVTVQVSRPGASGEQAILLVSPQTEITVQAADGTSRAGDVRDLVGGARIGARHTGTELRSLPPQYHATRIRVLAGP
jgi:hypothetical protein